MPESLIELVGLHIGAEEFLSSVLENAARPIWVADDAGTIRFANPAAIRALGYERAEQLAGRDSHLTIHGISGAANEWPLMRPLASGRPVVDELDWFMRSDGSRFRVSYASAPIDLPRGRGVVVVFTDVEARESTAIQDADAHAQLQRLADEQAALRRVATLVARESPPAEVFAAVTEEVGRLLGVEVTTMHRYEEGGATIVASWGERGGVLRVGERIPVDGENVTAIVHRTCAPARIDDYSTATGELGELVRRRGVHAAVACPIVVDGRLWGAMVAAHRRPEPLPAGTESRIAQFTELIATAIANVQARADLAASRARIVAATDHERRRVVRDLHDGAQQRLVQTLITLKLTRGLLPDDAEDASALLAQALEQCQQAMNELRELSHGILPTVLTHGGLRAGAESLAERMPVPVEVDVRVDRLPPPVEATAYFVLSEALTNVAKHARAKRAVVSARVRDGILELVVRDDGVGGASGQGSGLVGLADRVAVLDGLLRLDSPVGGGTVVTAAIPLEPETGRDHRHEAPARV